MESDWAWKILEKCTDFEVEQTQVSDIDAKSCEEDDFNLQYEGLRATFPKISQHKNHSTMILENTQKEISFKRPQTK